MVSEYIREQKRYALHELRVMLSPSDVKCSDYVIIRIINRLKSYGVLKAVKSSDEQLNMTDLVEEDVSLDVTLDVNKDTLLYVFTFVGVIIIEGRILKCYPKYIRKTKQPTAELKQIIKVLRKYNSKEQIVKMYNDGNNETSFNRLAVILFLLNDYFENGIYTKTEDIVEINGMGEIHWDKTINETYPIIKNNSPYYVELRTKHRVNDEENFIKKLHECILSMCSEELKRADLLELLDIEGVSLTDDTIDELEEDEYILYQLEKEMNVQYNTRKQVVLKTIKMLILNKNAIDNNNSFSLYGTNSFNLVWEKVCAETMNDCLHTLIKDLEIEDIVIPSGALYKKSDELISIIEKTKWIGRTEDNREFVKEADKTLTPDLISIYKKGDESDFIIFDAKYYMIQLEEGKNLCGQPGVGDVTKQYLYQLAFKKFVEANKIRNVRNCFLIPTEEDGDDGVIKLGSVRMDMFLELGLEQIQIRQLSAKKMYVNYLRKQKLDIEVLDL